MATISKSCTSSFPRRTLPATEIRSHPGLNASANASARDRACWSSIMPCGRRGRERWWPSGGLNRSYAVGGDGGESGLDVLGQAVYPRCGFRHDAHFLFLVVSTFSGVLDNLSSSSYLASPSLFLPSASSSALWPSRYLWQPN